jgi:hypothetical protein
MEKLPLICHSDRNPRRSGNQHRDLEIHEDSRNSHGPHFSGGRRGQITPRSGLLLHVMSATSIV